MYMVTYCINGELDKSTPVKALTADQILSVFKCCGYEENPFLSEPAWGRYFLHKYVDGMFLEVIIEEEDDV